MKTTVKQLGECPDQCSGKGQNRQMDVPLAMLDKFPPAAAARLQELGSPKRCTYCGWVYAQGVKVGIGIAVCRAKAGTPAPIRPCNVTTKRSAA